MDRTDQLRQIGAQIRRAREAAGESQKEAATAMGVAYNTLSRIERGMEGNASRMHAALEYYGLQLVTPAQSVEAEYAAEYAAAFVDRFPTAVSRKAALGHLLVSINQFDGATDGAEPEGK